MKVSLKWLQTYFDMPLPSTDAVAEALTFHAFEIEEANGDLLDVKVLPNRAADCLSHRGIAKELSAILDMPMTINPLRESLPDFPDTGILTVQIEDEKKCPRYMAKMIQGVKVGPSPAWLKEALESVGQRSINNIVDATNFVMLNVGQPLHAFDSGKLTQKNGKYAIGVRGAKDGEKITTLSGDEVTLSQSMLLITDANADRAIGIAGIKGGKYAEVSSSTTDIIVESANFEGTAIRRTAQALKLFTDASVRFQNRPSPEMCAYGMRDVLALITDVAGGEVVSVVDVYPAPPVLLPVSVSLSSINGLLGSTFSSAEVEDAFRRLSLGARIKDDLFTVMPPFERTDLDIPEDLVEEAGRILGYDRVPSTELPSASGASDQARYRGMERMKDQLVEQGYTEVSTQSFAKKGDVYLANPLDKAKPALRTSLEENLDEALAKAKHYAPLVLLPGEKPKLFEVGTVFPKEGEYLELRMTERVAAWGEAAGISDNLSIAKLEDYGKEYTPKKYELGAYKPFSIYPFVLRDIAFWAPSNSDIMDLRTQILRAGENLLLRVNLFDTYPKKGDEAVTSFAFQLVFESPARTLTDEEVNEIMGKISAALVAKGYEVR